MRCIPNYDKFVYQWSEEFKLLREYLSYLEKSVPSIITDITKKLWDDVERIDDGDQNIPLFGLIHPESAPKIFLRFLYNNYFLSLWATYETGTTEIYKFLSKANNRSINFIKFEGIEREKRKSFVDKIFKSFKGTHKIDIPVTDSFNQENLNYLLKLRNVIAHSNGRTNDVSKIYYADLAAWIDKQPEIIIEKNGWIYINHKFCNDAYNGLSTSFNDLSKLAYEKAMGKTPRPGKEYQVIY